MNEWALLVIAGLPLIALWIRSIVEVIRRDDHSSAVRVTWLLVLVLVPILGLAAYVVARTPPPPVGRDDGEAESDRVEQLVIAAERRQRGDLDEEGFRQRVAELQQG